MRILFLGGGNMATALIGGMLQQGFQAAQLHAIDVSAQARSRLQQQFGIEAAAALEGALADDIIVFAVKPQQMRAAAGELRACLRGQLVISIAAGIRTDDLARWLGGHARIVRAMPNTPALIRRGVTGLFAAAPVGQSDREAAQRILGAVGATVWLSDEAELDAVTAVSGSGPAYVFYFIEALEAAAVELGLTGAQAHELAVQTFAGAAQLAAGSSDPPATLRERVTSKAGTTEAALLALEARGVKQQIVQAVRAAAERSKQLGEEFGKL